MRSSTSNPCLAALILCVMLLVSCSHQESKDSNKANHNTKSAKEPDRSNDLPPQATPPQSSESHDHLTQADNTKTPASGTGAYDLDFEGNAR